MEATEKSIQQLDILKILIADDDQPTRILLRAAISQWGYEVVEAKDGEEAWSILQDPDAPRLMILDWLMPKLDGIALCERIKQESTYHPYIILLTQVSGTTNIVKGLEAGADEFLSKPFNMAELRSRLSVGARIVRFEVSLAQQNKQLQEYVLYLKGLSDTVMQLVKKSDDMLTSHQFTEATNNNDVTAKKFEEIQSELKKLKNDIALFNEKHRREVK